MTEAKDSSVRGLICTLAMDPWGDDMKWALKQNASNARHQEAACVSHGAAAVKSVLRR